MMEFKFPDPLGGPPKQSEQVTTKMSLKLLPLTPVRLAPPILSVEKEGKYYAPCFDSDDEFESDDGCSIADSKILFRRRQITPPKSASKGKAAPAKAVSLLTMQLKRCRNRNPIVLLNDRVLLSDGSDEEPSGVDNRIFDHQIEIQHPQTTTCSDAECSARIRMGSPTARTTGLNTLITSTRQPPSQLNIFTTKSSLPFRRSLSQTSRNPIETQANTCFNGPRKSGFLAAIAKAIITNFKNYTNTPPLNRKQLKQAIHEQGNDDEEEEIDPYILFFGNNQDQGIPPKKPQPPAHRAVTPATEAAEDDAEEEIHPYILFFGNNQDRGIPSKAAPKPSNKSHQKGKQPAATTTTTNPVTVPLTAEQQDLAREQAALSMSFQTGWVNNLVQIPKAGPLHLKRGDVSYIERDYDWVCCGCGAANSRYEFLCFRCGAHSKGRCCEEVVEELDGEAGWGVGGPWSLSRW
jgi:hypothetical protein